MNRSSSHILSAILLGLLCFNALAMNPLSNQKRILHDNGNESHRHDGNNQNDDDGDQNDGVSAGKIILIVLIPVAVIVFCITFWCLIYCFREKIVKCLESRKRTIQPTDMKQEEFEKYFNEFKNIFQENQYGHKLNYFENEREISIKCNSFSYQHLQPYRYKIDIKGQDLAGQVVLEGQYIKTQFGITFWFFKKYTNQKIVREQKSPYIVYQSLRDQNRNIYRGQWYYRGYEIQREKWSLAPPNDDGTSIAMSDQQFNV